jgi:DNA-binding MarR family transcriptional regulator
MRWQRAVNRALRPLGLTHTQLLVLHAAERAVLQAGADEGASHAAIAREAGLDRSTTGAVVRTLESRDLLAGDAAYRVNAWAVLITPAGLRALKAAAPLIEAASASLARAEEEEAPTPPPRTRRRPSPAASE